MNRKQTTVPFPDKKYSVIYADPPWRYKIDNTGYIRYMHYPRMKTSEICSLDVRDISEDDSVLYLWSTVPHLPDALEVVKAWGFSYRSQYVWVKDRMGTGWWVRNQHELLLVCKKGKISPPLPEQRRTSLIESPRRKHSQKPDCVRELLSDLYPDIPKIELFARERFAGWDAWGNEI